MALVFTSDVPVLSGVFPVFGATNSAPVAVADSLATDEDVPLVISILTDLFANDYDPDDGGNDPTFTFDSFTQPSNGVLVDNADGTLTYTPGSGFSGSDSFTYTITDGSLTDTATVTIDVAAVGGGGGTEVVRQDALIGHYRFATPLGDTERLPLGLADPSLVDGKTAGPLALVGGTNGYAETGLADTAALSTFAGIIKFDSSILAETTKGGIGNWSGSGGAALWWMLNASSGNVEFRSIGYHAGGSTSQAAYYIPVATLSDSSVMFFAVYEAATVKIYIPHVSADPVVELAADWAGRTLGANTNRLGTLPSGTYHANRGADIHETGIWNVPLSAAEVAAQYAASKNYWAGRSLAIL